MFPREVINRFPLLPPEEETRLNDMPPRENSVECIFAHYRWTEMLKDYRTGSPARTTGSLVRFHAAHKLTLMAHCPNRYAEMGRLVAGGGKRNWDKLMAGHGAMHMEGLKVMGNRAITCNPRDSDVTHVDSGATMVCMTRTGCW